MVFRDTEIVSVDCSIIAVLNTCLLPSEWLKGNGAGTGLHNHPPSALRRPRHGRGACENIFGPITTSRTSALDWGDLRSPPSGWWCPAALRIEKEEGFASRSSPQRGKLLLICYGRCCTAGKIAASGKATHKPLILLSRPVGIAVKCFAYKMPGPGSSRLSLFSALER